MEVDPVEILSDCRRVMAKGKRTKVDPEEILSDCGRVMVKGKRTKRRRPLSPFLGGIASSTSSSSAGAAGDRDGDDAAAVAVTTSIESMTITSTEEEEDMAHCLILLAQGGRGKIPDPLTAETKSGLYVYECKTCNRIFPSFQALGGHRASHKKPKILPPPVMVEPATPAIVIHAFDEEDRQFCKTALLPDPVPLHFPIKAPKAPQGAGNIAGGNKQKVHECSICGLEFGSGQALGGHMRRHRTAPTGSNQAATTNERLSRNILPLDLNLPAPENDLIIESKFAFGSNQQQRILFSSPALVDCHN